MPHRTDKALEAVFFSRFKTFSRILSFLAVLLVVIELGGVRESEGWHNVFRGVYVACLLTGVAGVFLRRFKGRFKVLLADIAFTFLLVFTLLAYAGIFDAGRFFGSQKGLFAVVALVFVREFVTLRVDFKRLVVNPAQLFVLSFLSIILLGALLLLLPNATHTGLSAIDALFTATSAVCVTGLVVVDTGSYFTVFGQSVIMVLIQAGGIGIMTFASYFSYFFRGGSSYENQILLRDMTNADKVGEVFDTLKKILLITFLIEFVGAVGIYTTLNPTYFNSFSDKVYFSVFHSISGFCNAGFSTLADSLYQPGFSFNYPLHLIIAALFICGGLGFPIVFNLVKYFKYYVKQKVRWLLRRGQQTYMPWVVNINSRIVLLTSAILLSAGTVLFYIFEYNNTLAEHSGFGKIVTAFFGAATTRTAGFNSVDTAALSFSTVMIVFLLMWIGASPASTGGGIKTSTFAIATLNFISLAKGKDRIEVFRREIAAVSVRRAFAIISLSLLVIGLGVFLVASFDSEKDLLTIAFECFSAYSTVGLSLGITGDLSTASKAVIIAIMFVGRVSMLTLLIAVMKKVAHKSYKYPTEEILIN